jgi:hypothetical protein
MFIISPPAVHLGMRVAPGSRVFHDHEGFSVWADCKPFVIIGEGALAGVGMRRTGGYAP